MNSRQTIRISPTWIGHLSGVTLVSFVFVILIMIVNVPLYEQQASADAESRRLSKLIPKHRRQITELNRLEKEISQIEQRATQIHSRLSDDGQETALLGDLLEIAARQKIDIRDYRRKATDETGALAKCQIELSCRASYPAICEFIRQLRHYPRLTKLEQLQIQSDKSTKYPVELTLAFFYRIADRNARKENELKANSVSAGGRS